MTPRSPVLRQTSVFVATALLAIVSAQQPSTAATDTREARERAQIAAASMEDAIVVDCQLPGSLQKLGGTRTYMTPGKLVRLASIDCRTRGGEFTLGDLSSGTLSLTRWMPLAQKGEVEAQYYVARIYANGMSGVAVDYAKAAEWYQKAASQGYASAQQELGYLYEQGLGVQKDSALALNLQRKAAGLGDELDYAWKITAAKEDAARQVAALSESLEQSNEQLAALREELGTSRDALRASRAQVASSADAVLDLRAELEAAKRAGSGQDAARVKQLQADLDARNTALVAAQQRATQLESQLGTRQEELARSVARAQAMNMELNELQATAQDTRSVRAQLAQAQQRLLTSQQELSSLRQQFQQESERYAAQRAQIERAAAAKDADGGPALLAAKQRELDRQQLQLNALQAELAAARKGQQTGTAAVQAQVADAAAARKALADMQQRYDAQAKLLQAQRQEVAALAGKSQQERTALLTDMRKQLNTRSEELELQQRRIASLESETGMLRSQMGTLEQKYSADAGQLRSQNAGLRETARVAQAEAAERREQLEKLLTESAGEKTAMLRAQDRLQQELAMGNAQRVREVGLLQAQIQKHEATIKANEQYIASLQASTREPMLAANLTMRQAAVAAPVSTTPEAIAPRLLRIAQGTDEVRAGHYHALVIGNSQYYRMSELATPGNDVRVIGRLLEQQYNFKVQTLLNATARDIMAAIYQYSTSLQESDSLLVYYAGHGAITQGSQQAFWLGVDADPDTRSTGYIAVESVKDLIKNMKAKHVLLVADSCFSGAITHATTTTVGRGINEQRFKILWDRKARTVLTSGQMTPVVDSSGDRNHSLFARYFIEVLRQNSALMSGEMLSFELSDRLLPEAQKMGIKQAPTYSTLRDANHNLGDFFFVPVPLKVAAL